MTKLTVLLTPPRVFVLAGALLCTGTSACSTLGGPPSAPVPLGAGKELSFAEFKQVLERYEVGVTPGNTVALQGAAYSYAGYIGAFHKHLHIEYAQSFLGRLAPEAGVFNDRSLVTKVEVVIEPDGSLNRLGVIDSSGDVHFDFESLNAVLRGAPYPPPPSEIRSPDGRTYLRWALHRDESQCGTWNAEPFILSFTLLPTSGAERAHPPGSAQ